MGLWPFGRTKADVETASRVVVLRARDAVALRAKVTVKFLEPQTQAAADQVLELCQDLVRAVVREAPSGAAVLGFDAAIAQEVLGRIPADTPTVRTVEIAGLHIVGDPGHLAQPTAGPESNPAWLHNAPAPSSSDRAPERGVDRPTPVHGFPPVGAPERGVDRLTPVHGFPPLRAPGADRPTPTTTATIGRRATNDGTAKVRPNEAAKPPPTEIAVRPAAPIAKPAAPADAHRPAAQEAAAKPRDGSTNDAPPLRPRDPFAATAQSPQPVIAAANAQIAPVVAVQAIPVEAPSPVPATPIQEPVKIAPLAADAGRADAVVTRSERPADAPDTSRSAGDTTKVADHRSPSNQGRSASSGDGAPHPPMAHAPTMPAMVAPSPPPAAAAPTNVATAAAPRAASPVAKPIVERSLHPSPGAYSAIGPVDPTPAPGAVRAREAPPAPGASRADPNAVRGRAGSTYPPPAAGGPYPHAGTTNALRPPPGPRRTSSSGQLAAVSLDDAARPSVPGPTRTSRSPDEPSSSSRNYGLSGPPSARGLRPTDEPSASSRSFAYLATQGPSSRNGPTSRASNRPPPAAVAARRRVVASRLLLPMGAGPYEVARGLTPLFRDTAGRILVAFLRTYDLTVIRRVPFDAVETDILSSLTAPSDGAPGTYAASHAPEIQRWRDAFGLAKLDRLQREANLAAAALAHEMFTAEAVPSSMTAAVVEGLAGSAFGDPDMLLDIGRYLYPARESTAAEALANMIELAGEEMPPGLEGALEPLFASLREEVAAVAEIAKEVMLTPG